MRTITLASAAAVVAATCLGASTGNATAQDPRSADTDTTQQLADQSRVAVQALGAIDAHPGATHAGAGQQFRVTDALVDPDGVSHVRVERTYRGLAVVGGDMVVHRDADGSFDGASLTLARTPRLSTAAAVPEAAARATAVSAARSDDVSRVGQARRSALVVDARDGTPALAWRVVTGGVQADGTPSRILTYVDASTGRTLGSEQTVETVEGSGESLYGGTVPLELTLSGGAYALQDPTRGDTYTTDLNNQTDPLTCQILGTGCPTGTTFTSADTSFGDGTTSSRESAGVDAQYGTNETWDYYLNTHGRSGIAGDGAGSFNRVHYGTNYANAFWQDTCFCMTYGDGDGSTFSPLTSLDVAGHEMSHGVTSTTAGLEYSGESGGLNEATSDIFGSLVEFYAANGSDVGDYLIGEEISLGGGALRYMDQPSRDGNSADCWSSDVGNLDVHYSSGVANHFFFLLAVGSGQQTINGVSYDSPTCDGSTVTGIGNDAAGAIWYRALTVYMTSGTDYAGARAATLSAADDLYGAGSAQSQAVAAAWSAVSVG